MVELFARDLLNGTAYLVHAVRTSDVAVFWESANLGGVAEFDG